MELAHLGRTLLKRQVWARGTGCLAHLSRLANQVTDKPEHIHIQTGTLGVSVPSPESRFCQAPQGHRGLRIQR